MPFIPPKKPRPAVPPPTPEEAEFFLWLASRQRRPSRDHRFPYYLPGTGKRSPYTPATPADGLEEPPTQPPGEPAAALPPEAAGKTPAGWTPGYRGLLTPPEPRGLLDLPQQPELPPPLSAGLALAAAPQPQPPRTAPDGWTPPGYQGLLSGPRGLVDRAEGAEPPDLLSDGLARALALAEQPPQPSPWAQPHLPVPQTAPRSPQPTPRLAQSGTPGQSGQSRAAATFDSRAPAGSLLPGDPAHVGAVGGLTVPPDYVWPPRPAPGTRPIDEELKVIVPEKRADFLKYDPLFDSVQKLRDYHVGMYRISGIGPGTERALNTFMSWEIAGVPDYSNPRDPNKERPAISGISPGTLDSLIAQNLVPHIKPGTKPMDLEPWQWPVVHVATLDHALREAGGIQALEQMPPGVAAAGGDIILRLGQGDGVRALQRSVEAVRDGRRRQGLQMEKLVDDGHFGNKTLQGILDATRSREEAEIFAKAYLAQREAARHEETRRNTYAAGLIVDRWP